jgi:Uncharacterised nucleotidyltransferase
MRQGVQSGGLLATARALAVDGWTGEVVDGLREVDVRPVLLKGATLAEWLYDDGSAREYADGDLLVAPADLPRARAVLWGLGFVEIEDFPNTGPPHAERYLRADGAEVDLHWTIPGLGVPPAAAWQAVSERAAPSRVGGVPVRVPDTALLALHVALHASQHGDRRQLEDLRRALRQTSFEMWHEAGELAQRLHAVEGFAAGLRLLPEGAAVADRLGLPGAAVLEYQRGAGAEGSLVLGLDRLARAPGLRARLALLASELFPPPRLMRFTSSLARRGRLGLVVAYAGRGARLAWLAWPTVRAWRRARALERAGDGG